MTNTWTNTPAAGGVDRIRQNVHARDREPAVGLGATVIERAGTTGRAWITPLDLDTDYDYDPARFTKPPPTDTVHCDDEHTRRGEI
ncbi:hypothetical protein [Nocardia miyunensis]|uniref:hypothetical protein n=1 Tax=Nocardia miyunensis TaxID=282684 RepID=UPI00082DC900|nr:hypothetical protein [Nocardia miyunensis]